MLALVLVAIDAVLLGYLLGRWNRDARGGTSAAIEGPDAAIQSGKSGIQIKKKFKPKLVQIKKPFQKFFHVQWNSDKAE